MHPQGGTYAPAAAPGDPAPLQFQKQPPQSQWSTGLYDCCDGAGNCYKTCLCPCITFGQIAEIIDKGSTSSGCSCLLYALYMYVFRHKCLYACSYRVRMREQYGLPEDPCNDFCVHICCEACSLCQMYRELKNRGFDMDIGWHANMARQGQTKMAPPMYQDMKR